MSICGDGSVGELHPCPRCFEACACSVENPDDDCTHRCAPPKNVASVVADALEHLRTEHDEVRAQLRKLARLIRHVEIGVTEDVRAYAAWRHLSAWLDAHADLLTEEDK